MPRTVRTKTHHGTFDVWPGYTIGDVMIGGVHYERDLIAYVLNECGTRKKVAVDVGAHIGTHTVPFARAFRRVYAYEPNPEAYALLRANITHNGVSNALTYRAAVGPEARTDELIRTDGCPQNAYVLGSPKIEESGKQISSINVETVSLDNHLMAEPIGLIKIDVEGFEEEVFMGAQELIRKHRPFIWVEREHYTKRAEDFRFDIFGFLFVECGYRRIQKHSRNFLCYP